MPTVYRSNVLTIPASFGLQSTLSWTGLLATLTENTKLNAGHFLREAFHAGCVLGYIFKHAGTQSGAATGKVPLFHLKATCDEEINGQLSNTKSWTRQLCLCMDRQNALNAYAVGLSHTSSCHCN